MSDRAGRRSDWTRLPSRSRSQAGAVVALLLLPLAYLVIRVAGSGSALDILREPTTWRLVRNTVLLAAESSWRRYS